MLTQDNAPKNGKDEQCREMLGSALLGNSLDGLCRSGRRGSGHASHWPRSPSTPPDRRRSEARPALFEDTLVQRSMCAGSPLRVVSVFRLDSREPTLLTIGGDRYELEGVRPVQSIAFTPLGNAQSNNE